MNRIAITSSSGLVVVLPQYLNTDCITNALLGSLRGMEVTHEIGNLTVYKCDEPDDCLLMLDHSQFFASDKETQEKIINSQVNDGCRALHVLRYLVGHDRGKSSALTKHWNDLFQYSLNNAKCSSQLLPFFCEPYVGRAMIEKQKNSDTISDMFNAFDYSKQAPIGWFLNDVSHEFWPMIGAYCNDDNKAKFVLLQRQLFTDDYPNFASYGHFSPDDLIRILDEHFPAELKQKLIQPPTSLEEGEEFAMLVYGALLFGNYTLVEYLLDESHAMPYGICALQRLIVKQESDKPDDEHNYIVRKSLYLSGLKFDGKLLLPSKIFKAYEYMVSQDE